jgi:hypothetical protein
MSSFLAVKSQRFIATVLRAADAFEKHVYAAPVPKGVK